MVGVDRCFGAGGLRRPRRGAGKTGCPKPYEGPFFVLKPFDSGALPVREAKVDQEDINLVLGHEAFFEILDQVPIVRRARPAKMFRLSDKELG